MPKVKNTNVTNRANTRLFFLECAARLRHHKFERVSDEILEEAERTLRCWIANKCAHLPSLGKTIK